jgi:DNA-binding LacI/PurR family transcriptional regulator
VGPGTLPGQLVGNYLVGLGHRSMAYFTTTDQDPAGQARLVGLREAFARAGSPEAVRLCVPGPLQGMAGRVIGRQMQGADDMADILSAAHEYERTLEAHASRHGAQLVNYAVGQEVSRENLRRYLYGTFEPLFGQVLADPGPTAWVTYSDVLGMLARSFLLSRGIAIPRRLSLVSFDDTIESFGAGLTSYDFNMTQVVHDMLDHILNYVPNRRRRNSPVEIPGTLMQRASSGPAPGT